MFHNTTQETEPALSRYADRARSQEAQIIKWWRTHKALDQFTPSDINERVLPGVPITSVRRALSDLTKAGYLVKTPHKRMGPYGRPEFYWRLQNTQLDMLEGRHYA
jgi:predicted ArsR family transcriptional regulator